MLKSRRDCRQLDFWAPIPQQVQLKSLSNPHQYKTVQSLQIDLLTRPVTVSPFSDGPYSLTSNIDLDQRVLVCSRDGRPSNSRLQTAWNRLVQLAFMCRRLVVRRRVKKTEKLKRRISNAHCFDATTAFGHRRHGRDCRLWCGRSHSSQTAAA